LIFNVYTLLAGKQYQKSSAKVLLFFELTKYFGKKKSFFLFCQLHLSI